MIEQGFNSDRARFAQQAERPVISGANALAIKPMCEGLNKHGFKLGKIALVGQAIDAKVLPSTGEATEDEIKEQANSFLQITTRVNQKENPGSNQASFVSFGLAGGIDTIFPVIRAIQTAIPRTPEGKIRVSGFGEGVTDQILIFVEAKAGELDPKQLLQATVLSPTAVYDKIESLTNQSNVQRARWGAMFDPGGKGQLHLDIIEGKVGESVQAYNPDGTDHFVAKLNVLENQEVEGIAMNSKPQTYTSLAIHPSVSSSMREKILAEQQWIAETPEGMIRAVISANADPTVECCRFSVRAMLKKVTTSVADGIESVSEALHSLGETAQTFGHSLRERLAALIGGGNVTPALAGGARYDNENCSSCGKNTLKEDGCHCSAAKS